MDSENRDIVIYVVNSEGELTIFTTLERALTEEEFAEIEANLAAYRKMMMLESLKDMMGEN